MFLIYWSGSPPLPPTPSERELKQYLTNIATCLPFIISLCNKLGNILYFKFFKLKTLSYNFIMIHVN